MVDADVIGSAKIFNADCLKMLGGGRSQIIPSRRA